MKTVLTIAGSKVVRSMLARGLAAFGCELIQAANERDGVEAAQRQRPDVVLLDVTLPTVDGRRVVTELRGDAATADIPLILLTDRDGADVDAEVVALGASGYVVKPFQAKALEHEVGKVLGAPGAAATGPGRPAAVRGRGAP